MSPGEILVPVVGILNAQGNAWFVVGPQFILLIEHGTEQLFSALHALLCMGLFSFLGTDFFRCSLPLYFVYSGFIMNIR